MSNWVKFNEYWWDEIREPVTLCEKLKALKEPVTQITNVVDTIRLNVGGTIFETTRGTMMQKPGTRLAEIFTPGSRTSPPVTKDGAYFIDASPSAFETVLNCLRRGLPAFIRPTDCDWNDISHAAKIIGLERRPYNDGAYIDFL